MSMLLILQQYSHIVLFAIESTSTDLDSFGLKICNEIKVVFEETNCADLPINESRSQQESSSNEESISNIESSSQTVDKSSANENDNAMSYFTAILSILLIII